MMVDINEIHIKKANRYDRKKKEAPFSREKKYSIQRDKHQRNVWPPAPSDDPKNSSKRYINNIPPHGLRPFPRRDLLFLQK
jgi:Tfp pilus assembly protein PilP